MRSTSATTRATWAEWIRFEAVVNVALAPYALSSVCAYEARILPEPILAAARATHPGLLIPAGRRVNHHYQEPADYLRRWITVDPDPLRPPSRPSTPATWSTSPSWRRYGAGCAPCRLGPGRPSGPGPTS